MTDNYDDLREAAEKARPLGDPELRNIECDEDAAYIAAANPQRILALLAERDELARWKAEARTVLGEWGLVYEAAGSPGKLGESIALATAKEVTALARTAWRLIERAESAEAEVATLRATIERVESIYNAWMAWDGSLGPDGRIHPDASSPHDRERLRAALSPERPESSARQSEEGETRG